FRVRTITAVMIALLSCSVAANDEGVGPFSLPLASSTPGDLSARFPTAREMGLNTWSGGPMYRVEGSALPLDGATSAVFIFDQDDRLDATLINLRKSRFEVIKDLLDTRYQRTSSREPFVGNTSVRCDAYDIVITLEAPHMSFEMELGYHTSKFLRLFRQGSEARQQEHRQAERSQL